MANDEEIEDYAEKYDQAFRMRPKLRSLVSRGSRPVRVSEYDEETGEWRSRIKMSRDKFGEKEKGIFLQEYAKWGRIGEAAAAAGVTTQTVRAHLDKDEEFAEAFLVQEEEYREKLIAHHQNLLFNGIEKNRYDRNGNLVETSVDYPIRLIELELKKHDEGYREKREVKMNHSGGVLVAPAEMDSVDDWERRFSSAKDITPRSEEEEERSSHLLGLDDDDED